MSVVKPISSRSNPQWQRLRKLAQQATAYREQGEVWVEGEHLCAEAVRRGQAVRIAVIGETAWQKQNLRQLAEAAGEIMLLPDALLAAMSSMDSAPPLAFVMPLPDEAAIDPQAPSLVLDCLQDAGNVGTILRSAAAFGFSQVIALKGSAALWSPKVLRAGMGAHFGLHLVEGLAAESLAELGVPLVATSSHAGHLLPAAPLPQPCAWVLGHEGQGVHEALLARCTLQVRIPQPGGEESLNVAAAAAVCLYESARRQPGAQ